VIGRLAFGAVLNDSLLSVCVYLERSIANHPL
jgi:hypothetical protein